MKKLSFLVAVLCLAAALFCGCARGVDYPAFISEKRTDIFIYKDDDKEIKIYCSEREQPYAADGIMGDICPIVEIFVTLPKNPQELEVSVESVEGEMNYRSVENCFYLSFTAAAFGKASVDVTLTYDGKSETFSALSVRYAGVMSCEQAVLCAAEHDKELFESLMKKGAFDGEIYVRLLYDEGCYYYVGVCDKSKKITAYLVDGEKGKVIAKKHLEG